MSIVMPCWIPPQELSDATSESVGQSDGLCLDPSGVGQSHKTASTGFICAQVQVGMHRYLSWGVKVGFLEFHIEGCNSVDHGTKDFRSVGWFKTLELPLRSA